VGLNRHYYIQELEPMKVEIEKAIKSLAQKADYSQDQDEAMKYSQAALNLAHTIAMLGNNERAKHRWRHIEHDRP
jgi:hypothetical protein